MKLYLKCDTEKVVSWKYKDVSAEKPSTPTTTNSSLSGWIKWYENSNVCLKFMGSCLKQEKATFTPPSIRNLFIVHESDSMVTRFKYWFYFKGLLVWGCWVIS